MADPVDAGLIDPGIVQYAMGYPVARLPRNIDPEPLRRKLEVFGVYASHDPVIRCTDGHSCLKVNRFGDWLQREYLIPHAELARTGE